MRQERVTRLHYTLPSTVYQIGLLVGSLVGWFQHSLYERTVRDLGRYLVHTPTPGAVVARHQVALHFAVTA